jgi:hypothetical protein
MVNLKEDIGVDGKTIFKLILKTGLEGMDYRLMWLSAGIKCRLLILLQ